MEHPYPDRTPRTFYRRTDYGGAVYDEENGRYRYHLWRDFRPVLFRDGPVVEARRRMVFVMLNPSTATEEVDDPTIRRCMGYAKREEMEHLTILNLFALRSTDPKALARAVRSGIDPIGLLTDEYIREVVRAGAWRVVVGWGRHGRFMDRQSRVAEIIHGAWNPHASSWPMWCLGQNQDGTPVHPLYQPESAELVPWP